MGSLSYVRARRLGFVDPLVLFFSYCVAEKGCGSLFTWAMEDLMNKGKDWALTEGEKSEIVIGDEDKGKLFSNKNVKLCLVAKEMSQRKVNSNSFSSGAIWKSHDCTRIETADNIPYRISVDDGKKLCII